DRVVADVEIAEIHAAEQGAHGRGDGFDRHAEIGGAGAVDPHAELGLGGLVVQPDGVEDRVPLHVGHQVFGDIRQRLVFQAGDGELHALAAAADAETVGGAGEDLDAGDLLELAVELRGDLHLAAG